MPEWRHSNRSCILYRIDEIQRKVLGRKRWTTVAHLDSQRHIAAAEIVKVVGDGAECGPHGIRNPDGFVLDLLAIDCALAYRIVDVDGKFAGHADIGVFI